MQGMLSGVVIEKHGAGLTSRALSSCARVWEAEMQTRQRADSRGVAGNPTTTTATPRCRHSLEKAGILAGWNSMMGCTSSEWVSSVGILLLQRGSGRQGRGCKKCTEQGPKSKSCSL